ncbi:DUF1090 family protein [Variovorax sp. LT1R16]|uniref:DUF1090 family protein n=1 Tax=Variovorax sp. LT1R16 TaxID=3443728 RepID=UPI003F44D629
MHRLPYLLVISILLATSALAQPSGPVNETGCRDEELTLIQEMEVAQARGRMLQRRQLADQLAAVQVRCGTLPPVQSREAGIARLQQEIAALRKELDRAETELRKLRQGL